MLAQLGNPPRKQENQKLGKGNFVGTNSLCTKLISYAQMFAYLIDEKHPLDTSTKESLKILK